MAKPTSIATHIIWSTPHFRMTMATHSWPDDTRLRYLYSNHGPPVLFANQEIRRMLNLAKAGPNDILLDLGCGWGQNLLIAAAGFGVKTCIGIDRLEPRYLRAKQRVRQLSLQNRITIINGQSEDLFDGKFGVNVNNATVIL